MEILAAIDLFGQAAINQTLAGRDMVEENFVSEEGHGPFGGSASTPR